MSEKTGGVVWEITAREGEWLGRAFDYYLDAKKTAGVSRDEALLAWCIVPDELVEKAKKRIDQIEKRDGELARRLERIKTGEDTP